MATPNWPNYFFTCPQCGKMIRILVGTGKVTPEETLFSVECFDAKCGWSGDLPFSEIHPLPM
jgi:hypothetical protein